MARSAEDWCAVSAGWRWRRQMGQARSALSKAEGVARECKDWLTIHAEWVYHREPARVRAALDRAEGCARNREDWEKIADKWRRIDDDPREILARKKAGA